MKFRKKPVVIEAIQYTGNNGLEINMFAPVAIQSPVLEPTDDNPTGAYIQIQTLEGCMIGRVDDWVIKGVNGEFYPCKPDIFAKTYEPAETPPTEPKTETTGWTEIGTLEHDELFGAWEQCDGERIELMDLLAAKTKEAKTYREALEYVEDNYEYTLNSEKQMQKSYDRIKEALDKYPKP